MLTSETERLVSESKMSAGKVTSYHMELVQKQRSEVELSDRIRRLESEIEQVSQNCFKREVSRELYVISNPKMFVCQQKHKNNV